jgi:phosphotransferase system HPr (HPr) family protein
MTERTVTVLNPQGLHARPAAAFVQAAKRWPCRLRVDVGGREADCKSILEVLMLGVEAGTAIHLVADGEQEAAALADLAAVVEGGEPA